MILSFIFLQVELNIHFYLFNIKNRTCVSIYCNIGEGINIGMDLARNICPNIYEIIVKMICNILCI